MDTVIFDMDGTLVDNIKFHTKAWLRFLRKYNIELSAEEFQAQNHGTIDEMILHFFGKETGAKKRYELGQEKEYTYRALYKDHIKAVNGLIPFLEFLRSQSMKIGLATMGDAPNIEFILKKLGLETYFHSIIGGHQINKGKPSPEIFLKSLEALDSKKETTIIIEDSKSGVLAARNAGIKVIGISTSYSSNELKELGCELVIDDYTDDKLRDFIENTA